MHDKTNGGAFCLTLFSGMNLVATTRDGHHGIQASRRVRCPSARMIATTHVARCCRRFDDLAAEGFIHARGWQSCRASGTSPRPLGKPRGRQREHADEHWRELASTCIEPLLSNTGEIVMTWRGCGSRNKRCRKTAPPACPTNSCDELRPSRSWIMVWSIGPRWSDHIVYH